MTVSEATAVLARAGVPNAAHDARVLARHADFEALVARRAEREPLQYILGRAPFRHLEVLVGPGAFIPRPETELLAGWVIDAVREHVRPRVVDLCSGPGTIALAVALELPQADVHAVEIDAVAAEWAHCNVEATGLPVTLHTSSVADALPDHNSRVDAVVANPPYIVRGSIDQPEVRDFEPAVALYDDSADGLAVIRAVIATARRLLRSGGLVAVEHGDDQGAEVAKHLHANGFVDVEDHRDLTGRDRFVTGRLP